MSYTNVTTIVAKPVNSFFDWVHARPKNFLNTHVLARGAHLAVAPVALVASTIDTVVGLGAGLAAICTLGKHQPTLDAAVNHLSQTMNLAARSYAHILRTIDPNAKFPDEIETKESEIFKMMNRNIIGRLDYVRSERSRLEKLSERSQSKKFLDRQVITRLTYALQAVAFVIARVAEGLISVPVAALSILAVGKFKPLNDFAYRTLRAPVIIRELFTLTILCVNPWTDIPDWNTSIL